MILRILRCLLSLVAVLAALPAQAHKASDAYLTLRADDGGYRGHWDIALRDLEVAVGLDQNGDGRITWGELRAARSAVDDYALARLQLRRGDAPCVAREDGLQVDRHSDGAYAVLHLAVTCPAAGALAIDYRLLQGVDSSHRGLLQRIEGGAVQTAVLVPGAVQRLEEPELGAGNAFRQYLREGVWHIWTGYDHLLFLLTLLLPAVLRREGDAWRPAAAFAPTLWRVAGVVSAFTLAHSITLTLAALDLLRLPSRLVESAIALSVVLAALNNVRPIVTERAWAFAFGFGLLHGFGFAGALADLGLPRDTLALGLFAFNLGVEAGQLAVVAAFVPLAHALRHTRFYRRVVLVPGSLAIAVLAALWLAQRALDLRLVPG